ncbi:hypothetical protein OOT00_14750 [Desulfobotulus sp. H1]|uniref:DUF5666 domain-containing protein n=1 Tax=Desulfobotulus pelophilus TaxID=2823377 RepID=A0ABT3NCQ4_9BACT|nr:hypothetical protein [Desulfobotulus pelophilus]MCW7755244.1 hypothetical protein [Desulfobotulus pelophilus]
MNRKLVWAILLLCSLAPQSLMAVPLFQGVVESFDPESRVVFIDKKQYVISDLAALEDSVRKDGSWDDHALLAGKRVVFQLKSVREGENRIVYLRIEN